MDTHAPYVLPPDAERPFQAPQEQELIPQEKWEKVSAGTYYVLNNRRDIGHYVASYDNCIRFADGVFQRVVENIQAHPEEGDWIIVFTADHGESLFEGPDRTANDHGWTLYDYELHVPLIISAPAYGFEPKRIKSRVQLLDLPETIAEMLGIQWPLPTQGRSLLPLMELGHGQEQPAIAEWSKQQANISIHLGSWHFIEERNLDTRQLFNLNEDPEELVDRGKDNPEMFDQMLRIRDHFMSRGRVLSLIFRAGEERMLDEEAIRHLQGLGYLQ